MSQEPNGFHSAMTQRNQEGFQAPRMSRDIGSDSSFDSMGSSRSRTSYHSDLLYLSSPITPSYVGSPGNEYEPSSHRHTPSSTVPASHLPLSAGTANERELPPFNIEKQGNPKISWFMYYNFVETETEAFYKLQPGYISTKNYPPRIKMEKPMG